MAVVSLVCRGGRSETIRGTLLAIVGWYIEGPWIVQRNGHREKKPDRGYTLRLPIRKVLLDAGLYDRCAWAGTGVDDQGTVRALVNIDGNIPHVDSRHGWTVPGAQRPGPT